jgi:hypothetical protein
MKDEDQKVHGHEEGHEHDEIVYPGQSHDKAVHNQEIDENRSGIHRENPEGMDHPRPEKGSHIKDGISGKQNNIDRYPGKLQPVWSPLHGRPP